MLPISATSSRFHLEGRVHETWWWGGSIIVFCSSKTGPSVHPNTLGQDIEAHTRCCPLLLTTFPCPRPPPPSPPSPTLNSKLPMSFCRNAPCTAPEPRTWRWPRPGRTRGSRCPQRCRRTSSGRHRTRAPRGPVGGMVQSSTAQGRVRTTWWLLGLGQACKPARCAEAWQAALQYWKHASVKCALLALSTHGQSVAVVGSSQADAHAHPG